MSNLKIKNISKNSLPEYATKGSSGLDLRANLLDDIILKPLERKLIPTGLFVEIPLGFEGQIRARSGLAIKHGITLINSVGTIDSDYRGELMIPLVNLSNEDYIIRDSERIAQLIIAPYERVEIIEVDDLSTTDRDSGGFGSTGIK